MIIILVVCAFIFSLLTFFSGFGLGTLLMPVMSIFFPVPIAIAITALVHGMNNVFKLLLLYRNVAWKIVLFFGLPALISAIPGAWLLAMVSKLPVIYTYQLLHLKGAIAPVKLIVGVLLLIFATLEWRSHATHLALKAKWLPLGGVLSGFFGGLSGQQGAFRTPFLLHAGLNKSAFVSTNAAIAVLVDITRLLIYGAAFHKIMLSQTHTRFILWAVLAAWLGAMVGFLGLKKITLSFIQRLVAMTLYILSILLIIGII